MELSSYNDPFDAIFDFESKLAEFTGAPYAVTTDRCTHAIELCLRYLKPEKSVILPAQTYLSVPQMLRKLNIAYHHLDFDWEYEYQIWPTPVWDSARRLEPDMYREGSFQCLSFGRTKPLDIGIGGAILTDSKDAYEWLSRARSDGRNLKDSPWIDGIISEGYHYYMRPEDCVVANEKLYRKEIFQHNNFSYPDCREIKWQQ